MARPHLLAQRADQIGVLGEAFDQDRAGAFQRRSSVVDLLVGVEEVQRNNGGVILRLRQQQVGERLQAGLLGDLGLGASLRLKRG